MFPWAPHKFLIEIILYMLNKFLTQSSKASTGALMFLEVSAFQTRKQWLQAFPSLFPLPLLYSLSRSCVQRSKAKVGSGKGDARGIHGKDEKMWEEEIPSSKKWMSRKTVSTRHGQLPLGGVCVLGMEIRHEDIPKLSVK